jgi:glutamate dehydrogenase (NAD(P)+)
MTTTDVRLPTNAIVQPDKDRFLNEENPFESMMSRFDRAADLLDLEPGLYKVLRKPEKQSSTSPTCRPPASRRSRR